MKSKILMFSLLGILVFGGVSAQTPPCNVTAKFLSVGTNNIFCGIQDANTSTSSSGYVQSWNGLLYYQSGTLLFDLFFNPVHQAGTLRFYHCTATTCTQIGSATTVTTGNAYYSFSVAQANVICGEYYKIQFTIP